MSVYSIKWVTYDANAIADIEKTALALKKAKDAAADAKLKAEFTAAKADNQYLGCYNDAVPDRTMK